MRLVAATLVPFFLLGAVELALRVAGYGHSTRLFLPRTIDGKDFLITNDKFTHRFFPAQLARAPLSQRIDAKKPAGTHRIFLLGESAAYGDPDPSFGVGRYLEALLETRYPDRDFEVVCVAITAINSHVILPIARECARREGDMWVVYMGNNEMVGPYGAGTVFGQRAPSVDFVRTVLALKTTRLGQLMGEAAAGLRPESSPPEKWEGIAMFRENKLAHDDPARLRAYDNFRANLEDILEVGREAGVPIVLSTVAVNLRDCSPFSSLHGRSLTSEQQAEWTRLFDAGAAHEQGAAHASALEAYTNAAAIDPDHAELQFRIGSCKLALGDKSGARLAFERARDLDALAVRADTRINRIIAEVAGERAARQALEAVDADRALSAWEPDGIPGQALFHEHVHLTIEGNFLLARGLADAVAKRLPAGFVPDPTERSVADELKACNRLLAVTLWDQKRVWNVGLSRISGPPFDAQSSHARNIRFFEERARAIDARTTPRSPAEVEAMYAEALARDPDDTLVRWNYAQYFERNGRLHEAVEQGQQICARLPHALWPHYFVGSVFARLRRMPEAADYLRQALRINPDFAMAREELERIRRSHPEVVGAAP